MNITFMVTEIVWYLAQYLQYLLVIHYQEHGDFARNKIT